MGAIERAKMILLGILFVPALYLVSLYSYLLFHSLVEIFSILVALCIFVLAWNSRRLFKNSYLLFLGIAFLFVGISDLLHTLAYKALEVFPGFGLDLSVQLWVVARFVQSISFLLAPLFINQGFKTLYVFIGYAGTVGLLLISIFYWKIFPVCFVEGVGLTPFKNVSEYVFSLFFLTSLVLLYRKRRAFDVQTMRWLALSLVLTIAAELSFTLSSDLYGLPNLMGHYLKVISFYLIYKALIENSLSQPYKTLFRNLQQSKEQLQKAHDDLGKRVEKRTIELMIANEQLRREIEAREPVERALQESLRLISRAMQEWESTVHSLPQFVCLIDEQGNILRANRTVERWNLGQEGTVKGQKIHELFHPHCLDPACYLESFWTEAREKLAAGRSLEREVEDKGTRRYLYIQVGPIVPKKNIDDDEDTTKYGAVVIHDITERKHAEEALRESEERYRNILANIEDGYFEVSLAGNFTFFNDSLCRILGFSKEEMMSMNNRQYMDRETAKKVYQSFNEVYLTRQPCKDFNFEVIRKDGTRRTLEGSISSIMDAKGEPVGFRGITHDITERKKAEEEKKSLEERLRQSQKMEAIGRLAGGVAHDFNNLLTLIKGYSQFSLLQLKEEDPLRGNIEGIEKASERAADLVRRLLAFSRRQMMEMKVLDLNALLRDLDKMLRRVIGEDIELVNVFVDDLGRVKVDAGQIEQVILNLAVNARDAMPFGGRLVIETANVEQDEAGIRSHAGASPGRYVMLSVSDTGVGMDPEVKERIFEPFFTTKEVGKGTGLGLAMVYGIVQQSGGSIQVYSEPGQGATFKIYLPRVDEPLTEDWNGVIGQDLPFGRETILVVEDEEEVRSLSALVLNRQGYRVLEASNGNEALMICTQQKEPIHLILTDVVMPQMGGKELADKLKILRPEIKVLFTSGYVDGSIVHQGTPDPHTAFLQKPYSPSSLARKIREVLER